MRTAIINRQTTETNISLKLCLDGEGSCQVSTGVGFFDHMLTLFAHHGLLDLELTAVGDLGVDAHHTVEDCGLVIGQALRQALGSKQGIRRYGTAFVPMDEALAMVVVDLSGRPYLAFDAQFSAAQVGNFDSELVMEFLRALSNQAGLTLHTKLISGSNTHHCIEAIFKALGQAIAVAIQYDARIKTLLSTKGTL